MLRNLRRKAGLERLTVALILIGAVFTYSLTFVPRISSLDNGNFRSFLIGLSSSLVVSVVIFLILERGLVELLPYKEVRRLNVDDFVNNMSNAKAIKILETYMNRVLENNEFWSSLETALLGGARVQVLLLHPYTFAAKQRASELSNVGEDEFPQGIKNNLAQLYRLKLRLQKHDKKSAERLEVKLYKASPSIAMYLWVNQDGDAFSYVNFFPVGELSDKIPGLKVAMHTSVGRFIEARFDELWKNNSTTISLESHMRLSLDPHDRQCEVYFAFTDETLQSCYVSDASPSTLHSLFEGKEKILIRLDDQYFLTPFHFLAEYDSRSEALRALQNRYDWAEKELEEHLNSDPLIFMLDRLTPHGFTTK